MVAATVVLVLFLTIPLNQIAGTAQPLEMLSADQRLAMAWVSERTPEWSSFLVVSGDEWPVDRNAEWFPVLAGRTSVATVQGSEWLAPGEFRRRVNLHGRAQRCGSRDGGCLETWLSQGGRPFTHVYVVRKADSERCCAPLAAALREHPGYALLYDGPGALILARTEARLAR